MRRSRGGSSGGWSDDSAEPPVDDMIMIIPVVATNTEAARLYERRGALPFITEFIQRVHSG